MGIFTWLGDLADQLLAWLGRTLKAFIDALLSALKSIWKNQVVSVLKAVFGFVNYLYMIFYKGDSLGETIMEIWNPNSNTSSEVFKMIQAPLGATLNKNRKEAKILQLTNK